LVFHLTYTMMHGSTKIKISHHITETSITSIDVTILYWPAVNAFNDLIQFLPQAQFHLTPKIHFSLVYVML